MSCFLAASYVDESWPELIRKVGILVRTRQTYRAASESLSLFVT